MPSAGKLYPKLAYLHEMEVDPPHSIVVYSLRGTFRSRINAGCCEID